MLNPLRRPLDLALWVLFVASAALILLAEDDPHFRAALCTVAPCPRIPHLGHKVVYDLAIGSFVSLFFYALVVRLPEYRRRQRIKRSFAGRYLRFKEDCISTMLAVADGTYDADLVDSLVDQAKFREYFKEYVSSSEERWHRFLNNLDEANLRDLKTYLAIFRDEIVLVLNSTDIPEDEPFEYLKRLAAAIRSIQETTLGYDETKPLSRFLWEVFAGFNWITGYREGDFIKKMIDSI